MSMKFNDIHISDIDFTDSKRRVLILGNGISRLEYLGFIKEWPKEIWGCNSIYKEVENGIIPRIDLITGDKQALKEALKSRAQNNLNYIVLSRNEKTHTLPGVKKLDIPYEYIYDSGTTLVCKALYEGYDEVYLVGFDIGGKDIYVDGHENRNKSSWVARWRKISQQFGLDKIIFIGRDHKDYILGEKPIDMYAKAYMAGKNHLQMEFEEPTKKSNKVLILGNGSSRKDYVDYIKNWEYELWVCNEAYIESKKYDVTRVGSVHENMIREAYDFKVTRKLDYLLFSRYNIPELKGRYHLFREKRGWSTGALWVAQAFLEHFDVIHLAGFDFGGPDLYKDYDLNGENFKKQFLALRRQYPKFKEIVHFIGKYPEFLQ